MLHGYRQLYSIHKNRRHLRSHCKNAEARFDTSNNLLDRPLPKNKNKKVFGLMKE